MEQFGDMWNSLGWGHVKQFGLGTCGTVWVGDMWNSLG